VLNSESGVGKVAHDEAEEDTADDILELTGDDKVHGSPSLNLE
jgi:hypothetical protein